MTETEPHRDRVHELVLPGRIPVPITCYCPIAADHNMDDLGLLPDIAEGVTLTPEDAGLFIRLLYGGGWTEKANTIAEQLERLGVSS